MMTHMLKVLVIDDDPDSRTLACAALRRSGAMLVRAVASGIEGVDAATRDPPDVILLDFHMPELDGASTVRALRAAGVTAKILFLTAANGEELRGVGAVGVLRKPFRFGSLAVDVADLLRGEAVTAGGTP